MFMSAVLIVTALPTDAVLQEAWVDRCCNMIWQTHEYVVTRLRLVAFSVVGWVNRTVSNLAALACSGVITQEGMLLFCAKVNTVLGDADQLPAGRHQLFQSLL
jgi:hypothetical protein